MDKEPDEPGIAIATDDAPAESTRTEGAVPATDSGQVATPGLLLPPIDDDDGHSVDQPRLPIKDEAKTEQAVSVLPDTAVTSLPSDHPQLDPEWNESKIFKNVFVVSAGFLFLFTAFQSMANLQTSLNKEDGVGTYSLSAIYGGLIVSCAFLPKFVIARVGVKWTIPICMAGYAGYMAANFHAVIWLMTIAGLLLGIGAAPMWSAKCAYLTQLGVKYSKLTKQSEDAVINKFFGFFFMMFQTSQIWGNLISSNVLEQKAASNETDNGPAPICGADFEAGAPTNNTGFKQPDELVRNLCIIYLCCALVAMVIVALLLDPMTMDNESERDHKLSPKLLIATAQHLISSRTQILLVPITMYSGVEQAFIGADFTQAYVSCSLGVAQVGYIFICYGVVDAICSFIFGRLVQYVGHTFFFVLATLVHLGLQINFLVWVPSDETYVQFFVIAGFWGLGDAIIQTQLNALYGALFTENTEAAFANYRLWESLGFLMTYLYQAHIRTKVKLYICMYFLIAGIIGYAIVEVLENKKPKKADGASAVRPLEEGVASA
ncbi:protein unc-93 homolog A-like isoform X2 [Littorina saxatilis]|uniref:protein unc-93 homolog A-like isoform X2 n=1 Tax=Littorina saxatilis TaxID=31220 RepID=UPI0038B4669F